MTTSYRLYKIDSMTTINASPQIPNAHDIALHVSAQLNESTACVIFTQDLSIIHAQNCTPTPDDLKSLKDAFGDREAAISRGLFLDKTRFEVRSYFLSLYATLISYTHTHTHAHVHRYIDTIHLRSCTAGKWEMQIQKHPQESPSVG